MTREKELPADILRERALTGLQVSASMKASNPMVSRFMAGQERVADAFVIRWARAAGVSVPRARRAYLRAVVVDCGKRAAWARRLLTTMGRAAISPPR